MIKLNIVSIEKKLNKRIRRNCISIGFDVAERFTGICILKVTEKEIIIESLEKIETNPKDDSFHRADNFINSLTKFQQEISKYNEFKILTIEDCYFGMNPETLKHLARFSILVYRELKNSCNAWYLLLPMSARSIIGFNQRKQEKLGNIKPHILTRGKNKGKEKKIACKDLVHDYLKTDFGVVIEDKDEADAFVLSLAGILK